MRQPVKPSPRSTPKRQSYKAMAGDGPETGAGGGSGGRKASWRELTHAIMAMAPWCLLKRADRLDGRLDSVEARLDSVETTLGLVDQRVEAAEIVVDTRVGAVETRLDSAERALGVVDRRVGAAEVTIDDRAGAAETRLDQVEGRVDGVGSELDVAAKRMDGAEEIHRKLQSVVEDLGTIRIAAAEDRIDAAERGLGRTGQEVERLRDGAIPAAVRRADALLERLNFELEETASLVERLLLSEPLPIVPPSDAEDDIARSLAHIQPALLDALRGSEAEIAHRLAANLPLLRDHAPVLDLGCGRGELLVLLREEGIEAVGVEGDPALAQGARRRGLSLREGDVFDILHDLEDDAFGAVTAFHLFEHLTPARILEVLKEARRVLRPGGVLLAECPNPHSLRVGSALFWLDPTHVRPLLPETLQLLLRAAGFEVGALELRHPFPDDQLLTTREEIDSERGSVSERISEIERRFDDIVSGPRDFMVLAHKPGS
jgi:SAM-dependent methyltransferase